MIDKLNLKEIAKQIKTSGKNGSVIWSRQKKQHYISNRHFLLRVPDVPSEILISLFSIFLKVPSVGETLICNFGKVLEDNTQKPIIFDNIYIPDKQTVTGQVTSYIKEIDEKLKVRIIKFPNHFSYIDEKYMKMSTDKEAWSTDNRLYPVYFADKSLILLPFRIGSEDEIISELIGNENE